MRWMVRLEPTTDQGEVETTELVTIERPVVGGTLADLGLALSGVTPQGGGWIHPLMSVFKTAAAPILPRPAMADAT